MTLQTPYRIAPAALVDGFNLVDFDPFNRLDFDAFKGGRTWQNPTLKPHNLIKPQIKAR